MTDGRTEELWTFVSQIGSYIYNHVRTKEDKTVSANDLNPYVAREKKKLAKKAKSEQKLSGWVDADLVRKDWDKASSRNRQR